MTNQTRVATRVLPATGATVPAEPDYVLGNLREMETHDGVAFNASVKVGRALVGTIENQGSGGGTWFRPLTAAAHTQWQQWIRGYSDLHRDEQFLVEESAADLLYTEADLLKRFKRFASRGSTVVRERVTDHRAWMLDGCPFATVKAPAEQALRVAASRGYEVFLPDRGWVDPAA